MRWIQPQKWFLNALFHSYSLFLISGNLLRLVDLGFTRHGLLISELILYFFIFCSLFCFRFSFSVFLYLIVFIVSLSAIYGSIYNEFQFTPLLFSMRLIAMIFTGTIMGKALYLKFGDSILETLRYFEKVYLKNIMIGFVIYFLFFDTHTLWPFLSLFGFAFEGDSHEGRFISPYLCPNLFGAIGQLPFIISYHLSSVCKETRWKTFLFGAAILLTWSRSGLAAFVFLLIGMYLSSKKKAYWTISKKSVFFLLFASVPILLIFIFSFKEVQFFVDRFIHMNSCPSAKARSDSFVFGLDIVKEHPFWGIGYNYLATYLADYTGLSSIDSSLLSTLVTFGSIIFVSAVILFVCWFYNFLQKMFGYKQEKPELFLFFKLLSFYLFICIVFTSQFNNLLYYPFWLVPVLTIFSYLSTCQDKSESANRNKYVKRIGLLS